MPGKRKVLYNHTDADELDFPATPATKKQKTGERTNSNLELDLSSIYKDCVNLGNKNKINQKNAWSLRLLDYISTVFDVEEKQKHKSKVASQQTSPVKDICNFKLASNTLDASIKIYACRVDNVHTTTYKVLDGLSRNANKPGATSSDLTDNASDQQSSQQSSESSSQPTSKADKEKSPQKDLKKTKTRKQRLAMGKTLETNPFNLNVKKLDQSGFNINPLFSKMAAAFDEGGAKGLLLGQLGVVEGGNIVFDSVDYAKQNIDFETVETYPISSLVEFIEKDWDSKLICNDFTDFSFTWEREKQKKKKDRFHVDEEDNTAVELPAVFVEELPDTSEYDEIMQPYYNNNQMDENDNESFLSDPESVANQSRDVINQILGLTSNITEFDYSALVTDGSDEFNYFNKKITQNWAGPEHWNFRKTAAANKAPNPLVTAPKQTRKKKEEFFVDFFSEDTENRSLFRKATDKASTLSLQTLEKNVSTSLPEDVRYDISSLTTLFLKPFKNIGYRRIDEVLMDGSEGFKDLSSQHESDNESADEEDKFEDDEAPGNHMPVGMSQPTTIYSQNLINEPDKVAKLNINYAKRSIDVDIEKLKTNIWNKICEAGEAGTGQNSNKLKKPVSFDHVLSKLPQVVPPQQLPDISVPLCFICLLDLANKKQLNIKETTEEDLEVSSYVPPKK